MNGIHEVTGSIPVWSTTFSFDPSAGRKYSNREEVTTVRSKVFPLNATPSGKLAEVHGDSPVHQEQEHEPAGVRLLDADGQLVGKAADGLS